MGRYTQPIISCPMCHKDYDNPLYTDAITDEQRQAYISDAGCIQNIMPRVNQDIRECLISGMCLECQVKVFGS